MRDYLKPVTWNTVKRLFNGIDIAYMHMLDYPLDDYEFVAANAKKRLLPRIENGTMPPRPFKPWTPEMIQTFKDWIDGGCRLKVADADIHPRLKKFIALSEFLTGFDDLHDDPHLAEAYLKQIEAYIDNTPPPPPLITKQDLDGVIEAGPPTAELVEQYKRTCKTIILVWYTSTIVNDFGFPIAEPAVTAQTNQWRRGLVWRAAAAHPMARPQRGPR